MIKKFDNSDIRIFMKKGEPWFSVSDVCVALDIRNVSDTISRTKKDYIGTTDVVNRGGKKDVVYIVNEPGLYSLIFKSRKEAAEKFKSWVFEEVLPSIRKTGSYSIPGELKQLSTDTRKELTKEWQKSGVEGWEYGALTNEEYRQLMIKAGTKKPDMTRGQIMLLQALESLEAVNLMYNPKEGYIECKESLQRTGEKVRELISNKPTLLNDK